MRSLQWKDPEFRAGFTPYTAHCPTPWLVFLSPACRSQKPQQQCHRGGGDGSVPASDRDTPSPPGSNLLEGMRPQGHDKPQLCCMG